MVVRDSESRNYNKMEFVINDKLKKDFVHSPIFKHIRRSDDDVEGCITVYEFPFIASGCNV